MTDSNFIIKKGLDVFDGDVSLKGSNKELRFYEGSNYVGFEAPALTADKIWVLPNADGDAGQALKTDGSGNLGWVSTASLTGAVTTIGTGSANAKLTSSGSHDLVLTTNTNAGFTEPYIQINDGDAGAIYIVNGDDANSKVSLGRDATSKVEINGQYTLPQAVTGTNDYVLTAQTDGTTAWAAVSGDSNAGGVNGSTSAVTFGFTSDTDTGMYRVGAGLLGFTSNGQRKLQVDPYGITVGDGNSAGYISSEGTQDLILRTNDGTNSGVITLTDGADGDINVAPNGTGSLLVNYSTSLLNYGTQVASNDNNVVPFSSTNKTTATNSIQTTGQFINAITSGSRTTGFGSQIEFRLGEINYAGYLAGKIGAKMQDTGNANFDMFITPQGTGNLALGNFTLDADQSVGSDEDNYVMTYDHSAGTIGLEAAAGGGASVMNGLTDVIVDTTNFADGFLLQTDSNGSTPTFNNTLNGASGNIGLGASVFRDLTTGDYNVGLGFYALRTMTTGTRNVGIGYEALGNTTTSKYNVAIGFASANGMWNAADGNVAIGYQSLAGNQSANDIVGIGRQAGYSHTSGAGAVYLGAYAGKNNTTGARNIAIGYQAYDNADTESDNIAIGYDALGGTVAGAEKITAIGNFSMASLTSGDDNLGIGYYSGNSLDDGAENILIGNYAGRNITSASRNVAIGHEALDANSTGNDNVAIASQALGAITTGSTNNIGIGFRAGKVMAANATHNTLIGGYEAGGGIGDGDYNVMIGSFAGQTATGDSFGNTFVGSQSGSGSSGVTSQNTGLGYDSLGGLSTGRYNIGIGYGAGDNITTGSNNVVIGKADVPSATGDSQLSISDGDGSVTWITGNSSGFVTHTNGSDHTFVIVGEEGDLYAGTGSTGNANGYQFSYGNGRANVTQASNGTDFGINVPHDCTLERIDVVFGNSGNVSTGTTTFVVVKNGSNQSGNLSTNHTSGVHDTHHTGLSHSFSAGDRFNLRTTTSSRQVGPLRMTATFKRTA